MDRRQATPHPPSKPPQTEVSRRSAARDAPTVLLCCLCPPTMERPSRGYESQLEGFSLSGARPATGTDVDPMRNATWLSSCSKAGAYSSH